jgi:hypothetical protein
LILTRLRQHSELPLRKIVKVEREREREVGWAVDDACVGCCFAYVKVRNALSFVIFFLHSFPPSS